MANDEGPQAYWDLSMPRDHHVSGGYLRFLLQLLKFGGRLFESGVRLRHLSEEAIAWGTAQTFHTVGAREARCAPDGLQTIVNEGRRLIGCSTRRSVAIRRGGRCPIEAVSGQDTIDKRLNINVMLGDLASGGQKRAKDVWFTGDTSTLCRKSKKRSMLMSMNRTRRRSRFCRCSNHVTK